MEGVLAHVVERLSDPEVLFGLSVRFFGVFIVLGIVMVAIYIVGRVFVAIEKIREQAAPPDAPEGSSAAEPFSATISATPPSAEAVSEQAAVALPPSRVPDEAAVAIAMALAMVPTEVAVAVTLALDQTGRKTVSAPLGPPLAPAPAGKEEPGSAWKLMGRQEGLFRRTSLMRNITPKRK